MAEVPQGNTSRKSTRLMLLKFSKNVPTEPIHINLGDDIQNNGEENIEIPLNEVQIDNNATEEVITNATEEVIIGHRNDGAAGNVFRNDSDDDFQNPPPKTITRSMQKRLDDSNRPRKVKRKLVSEEPNIENPTKKTKGKKKNDKTEGKFKLVDEEIDEDMGKALVVNEKEAQMKGKKKMCKKKMKVICQSDDKVEKRRYQKEKIEERKMIVKKDDEIVKSRNSPSKFSDVICVLSDEQQKWVISAGFKSLLHFDLVELPQRLAYKVLEAFDDRSCKLVLKNGDIKITDQVVHDVLGLSCRGDEIKFANGRQERINQWRAQFQVTDGQSLVKVSEVVDKMKQSGNVDELFKMNFLVVMTNVLIRSNTNNSASQTILLFDDELDNCARYNWARYLIESLVITKKRWLHTSSLFYTGPMIFLTILYVDRLVSKGQKLGSRIHPAFRGWTKDKLKERELLELGKGAFGTGIIREAATAEELEENASGEPHDGDWFERLTAKASILVDAKVDLMEAEKQYKSELANAKNLHPDDNKLDNHYMHFRYTLADYFGEMEFAVDSVNSEQAQGDSVNSEQAQGANDAVLQSEQQEVELPPDHEDNVDILKWLNSPEGLVAMQQDYEDMLAPSFSLGVSQICKEITEEHGEANIDENKEAEVNKEGDDKEEDNNITPMDKEPKKRAKRDAKKGPAFRSPFVQRITDINSKYTAEEFSVWRWIIQAGTNDDEFIFVCGEQNYTREIVKTLKPEKQLSYHVIDMFSILLNERENYKSPEAPKCIYLDICLSHAPLDEKTTPETQFVLFKNNMQHFFERYPDRNMKDTELVFFPVYAHGHFYLICFNLKKPSLKVIDNIRRGKDAPMQYGKKIQLLHKHFVDYLLDIKLEVLASSVKNVNASYVAMPWQTLANPTDCGLFLMRHMETYKGDPKKWKSGLKVEKRGQKAQLEKLRAKYCHAILTFPLNEKRNEILSEAKCLYNKIAKEKLVSIVIEANSRSTVQVRGQNVQGRKKIIEGIVLFP